MSRYQKTDFDPNNTQNFSLAQKSVESEKITKNMNFAAGPKPPSRRVRPPPAVNNISVNGISKGEDSEFSNVMVIKADTLGLNIKEDRNPIGLK